MDYLLVGVNHKTAPVELREKLSISDLQKSTSDLLGFSEINEVLILSTCNRFEIYVVSNQLQKAREIIESFFSNHFDESIDLSSYLYFKTGKEVSLHLFSVASSLDSMVLGENQISGQVKDAYEKANSQDSLGFFLHKLFHEAFRVSKIIRSETDICKGFVSVGSVGVDLAKKLFEDISQKKVGFIGAGEMAELVLQCLHQEHVSQIKVINRSQERALELLKRLEIDGKCFAWEKLEDFLTEIDILISSVGSDKPVIDMKTMEKIMSLRQNRVLFIIDLGVPRNIEASVNDLGNIYLYNIDDIKQITEKNKTFRQKEAKFAQEIIEKESVTFYENLADGQPVLRALGEKFDSIREVELLKTLKKVSHLSAEDKVLIENCTKAIVKKILHDPMLSIRAEKDRKNAHNWIKKIFNLGDF